MAEVFRVLFAGLGVLSLAVSILIALYFLNHREKTMMPLVALSYALYAGLFLVIIIISPDRLRMLTPWFLAVYGALALTMIAILVQVVYRIIHDDE